MIEKTELTNATLTPASVPAKQATSVHPCNLQSVVGPFFRLSGPGFSYAFVATRSSAVGFRNHRHRVCPPCLRITHHVSFPFAPLCTDFLPAPRRRASDSAACAYD